MNEYRSKRDFSKTKEPKGGKRKSSEQPIFVIQKHDVTNLHYDFRLEIGGTLKSWSRVEGEWVSGHLLQQVSGTYFKMISKSQE